MDNDPKNGLAKLWDQKNGIGGNALIRHPMGSFGTILHGNFCVPFKKEKRILERPNTCARNSEKFLQMKKLTKNQENNVRNLLEKKVPLRKISTQTGVSKSSIQRLAKKLKIATPARAGRPKKLSKEDITFSTLQLSTNRAKTAESLTRALEIEKGIKVHRSTLSRALHDAGMKSAMKKKKPALSKKNVKERLAFAKSHRYWTVDDWKTVIFSDETKINRFGSDGITWTWYKDGQTPQVKETTKHGGGHLMLWGCITSRGIGYMCEIEGIMDQHLYRQILEHELADTFEFYQFEQDKMTFQHDNDPKHTAKSVSKYLSEQEFRVMTWPPQSPDLNPIENCWSYLKNKVYSHEKPANGLKELFTRVEKEWEEIPAEYLTKLYESMPRRMEQVIKAKGRWTKY
jgi:transposase